MPVDPTQASALRTPPRDKACASYPHPTISKKTKPQESKTRRTIQRICRQCSSLHSIFSVHPLLSSAVSYIAGRSSVLCAVFYFLAVLFFLKLLDAGMKRRQIGRASCRERV